MVCIACGCEFEQKKFAKASQKFCSSKCQMVDRTIFSITYTCQQCGIDYHPKNKERNRYCSRACSYIALAKERVDRSARIVVEKEQALIKVCRVCGASFSADKPNNKVCSDECKKTEANTKAFDRVSIKKAVTARACKGCGKEFSPEYGNKRRFFCSDKCIVKHTKKMLGGSKHRHKARRYGVEYEPINVMKVFARDSWTCQICGRKAPERLRGKNKPSSPELDHRIPMSKGGSHTYDNVQCACRRCNGDKGNRSEAGQMPLFSDAA